MQNIQYIAEKWDLICWKSERLVDDVIKARETSIMLNPYFSI